MRPVARNFGSRSKRSVKPAKSWGPAQTFCLFTPVALYPGDLILESRSPRMDHAYAKSQVGSCIALDFVLIVLSETVLVLVGCSNCSGANRGAVRFALTCGAMSRIAILKLIEYEYRDAEYEKKHGASIGPTCSIERFMLFVYRRIRPWYKPFVVLQHWPS